jgi:cell division septation protein DedD
MDSSMRDLEQLRERDDDGDGRPLALVGILVGVTVTLVLAMGVAVGSFGEDEAVTENDPLARLDQSAGLEPSAEPTTPTELPEVRRSELTFPHALTASDERPEVAAALVAAAAELAHPDPLGELPSAPPPIEALPTTLPAAMAAAPGSELLVREVARDPLMAEALPAGPRGPAAPSGRDGEYTVQVISYDSPEGAEAFAAGLRARGHRAFVMTAQVPDRGTVYRVRVGPFETQREAQAYRRQFEQTERMNTLLVRRRDSDA